MGCNFSTLPEEITHQNQPTRGTHFQVGVEIIALDFERIVDTSVVHNNIRRLKKRFNVRYPILFAGSSDKKVAAESLPILNRVFAFPTTIFPTSEKKVFKIHTGFNGPATGDEYEKFAEWFQKLVAGLN